MRLLIVRFKQMKGSQGFMVDGKQGTPMWGAGSFSHLLLQAVLCSSACDLYCLHVKIRIRSARILDFQQSHTVPSLAYPLGIAVLYSSFLPVQ
mmetsp:Transcript_7626/g.47069  ORF Transcript_7626/g.47069 Transcript_7626/m.47069 type:complete len:93 (-) Transcript_7626:779-1057(-)